MLPRVDLPDLIDVMAWQRGFVAAFAGVSGGRSRLADLHVTIAAALTAHALNVGYVPVISGGVPALDRVPRLRREQAIPCEAGGSADRRGSAGPRSRRSCRHGSRPSAPRIIAESGRCWLSSDHTRRSNQTPKFGHNEGSTLSSTCYGPPR